MGVIKEEFGILKLGILLVLNFKLRRNCWRSLVAC